MIFAPSLLIFFVYCGGITYAGENASFCGTNFKNSSTSKCDLPWFYYDNGTCVWREINEHILQCDCNRGTKVFHGYCVTYNKTTGVTEAGECIYNIWKSEHTILLYTTLEKSVAELNKVMCGPFNRTGTLCGRCKSGYYPLVYSVDMNCVQCPKGNQNWWKLFLAAFFPLTVFYFVILVFRSSVTSSHLHGFVFCSQFLSIPVITRVVFLHLNLSDSEASLAYARSLMSLYGIWNLDFFRTANLGICLHDDTLLTLALDLAIGVYPFFLILTTYILIKLHDKKVTLIKCAWKPFAALLHLFHQKCNTKTSLIDVFTSFFFLSSVKLMSVCFDLLVPVQVHQLDSTGQITIAKRLFYDATIPYFQERHLPYAILGITVLFIFIVMPCLLFILYPISLFQRCLNLFPFRWYVLHTFMDSFQGCYKDGTQPGTCDCRWFAVVFFVLRAVFLLIGALLFNIVFYPIAVMMLVVIIILLVTFQPFKDVRNYCDSNTMFMLLLGMWLVSLLGIQKSVLNNVKMMQIYVIISGGTTVLPLLYATFKTIIWFYRRKKFGLDSIMIRCLRVLHARKRGYIQLK